MADTPTPNVVRCEDSIDHKQYLTRESSRRSTMTKSMANRMTSSGPSFAPMQYHTLENEVKVWKQRAWMISVSQLVSKWRTRRYVKLINSSLSEILTMIAGPLELEPIAAPADSSAAETAMFAQRIVDAVNFALHPLQRTQHELREKTRNRQKQYQLNLAPVHEAGDLDDKSILLEVDEVNDAISLLDKVSNVNRRTSLVNAFKVDRSKQNHSNVTVNESSDDETIKNVSSMASEMNTSSLLVSQHATPSASSAPLNFNDVNTHANAARMSDIKSTPHSNSAQNSHVSFPPLLQSTSSKQQRMSAIPKNEVIQKQADRATRFSVDSSNSEHHNASSSLVEPDVYLIRPRMKPAGLMLSKARTAWFDAHDRKSLEGNMSTRNKDISNNQTNELTNEPAISKNNSEHEYNQHITISRPKPPNLDMRRASMGILSLKNNSKITSFRRGTLHELPSPFNSPLFSSLASESDVVDHVVRAESLHLRSERGSLRF